MIAHGENVAAHEVKWGPCCFCALEITQTSIDPCRVTVETAGGKWQVWFCHAECFKERLSTHPEMLSMFPPAHF
jgi:hypothetical protein